MFKTLITAAAFSIAAAAAQAGLPTEAISGPSLRTAEAATEAPADFQTAAYCEWITVYDYWGNWVTYWQCY